MHFLLGPFTFDIESRQLRRGADAIHISPKAFELLKALVEARPRALSKVELHERLWPGTFVSDANLAILIAEIRRALDDDPHRPRFVRTLHRFGYAFSGDVMEVGRSHTHADPGGISHWFDLAQAEVRAGRGRQPRGPQS